jgi:hypothetical protein
MVFRVKEELEVDDETRLDQPAKEQEKVPVAGVLAMAADQGDRHENNVDDALTDTDRRRDLFHMLHILYRA